MKHFRGITHIDTFPLLASLAERMDEFDTITLRQDTPGSPHKDTRAIFLMGPEFSEVPDVGKWFEDVPHIKYPILADWPEADAMLVGGVDYGKAMLVELKPGGALAWHVDEGAYAQAYDRYHLPLTTNPGCLMYSGGEQAHLPVGALTWFDTSVLHSAINTGSTPRIHLIVDVRKG